MTPPANVGTETADRHFDDSRSLTFTGLSLQLTLLGLVGLAFQIALPNLPSVARLFVAGSIAVILLISNFWIMSLMPRADWARFFRQTLESSKRRRIRNGWYRTRWLRRWRHETWDSTP